MPNELSIIVDAVLNPASLSEIQNEIAKLSKGTKIDITADTGKAKKEVDDLRQKITNGKGQAKIVVDIDKGKSNANINTYLNGIRTKLQNSPIKLTFDVDKKATQNNIKNAVDNTQQQIQKATKDATKQTAGKTGATKPVVVPPRSVNRPEDYGELQRTTTISSVHMDEYGNKLIEAHTAIDQMNRALGETVTVVSQLKETEEGENKEWQEVSHTLTENFEKRAQEIAKINDYFSKQAAQYESMRSAALKQKNPLQGEFAEEAIKALDAYKAKYEEVQAKITEISDDGKAKIVRKATADELREIQELQSAASRVIQEQRAKQTQSISDQLQLSKAQDEITKLQEGLDVLRSKAFERGNQLTGQYAKPVTEGIDSIQGSITTLDQSINTGNLTQSLQTIKNLGEELKKLDLTRIKQQNIQFQARQLSATDITQQIPILKNDVTALENRLKNMGFGGKFQSQIDSLRDLIKTLGQPGGATAQQYNSQMKQLKSDVTRYQGTVRGRADVASTGITNNQLQSIQGINKVLNAQANTEGIQKARQELSALADEYKKLQAQLQSGKLSNARLGVIDRETKELDQQLRTYQNLAKNLNGDASSKQWVADQETGIQKMKASFTEYQETISKTIQLTPQLQSQMNALSDTMNRSGAVDVANWKEVQTQFEQLKISVDQFKNSVQGQASALSINIETNKLQEVTGLLDKLNNTTVQSSGIASVRTELEALSAQYQEVVTQLQNPNLGEEEFKKLSDTVDELDKRFTTLPNRTSDSFLQKYQLDADNLSQRFEKLKQKYEDFVKVNPNGGNAELEASFERIQESINNINPDNISIVQKEVRNLGTEVSRVVGPSQTLGQVLRDSFGGLGGYLARFASGAAIIQKTISVIKSMVTEVKALDTSLVELQKVTGLTGDALSQFTDKAYQVGSSLGRTGQDVIDAVTTFSRAGYELKEATDLAQAALVMTNIGPDITSTESAASDMISIFKAYEIEAEDAMGVIDRLYNVANKEPLDFGNITQMLVTAGGTLAQTGTTLDQTMGLLTSAFATMRDESVANG